MDIPNNLVFCLPIIIPFISDDYDLWRNKVAIICPPTHLFDNNIPVFGYCNVILVTKYKSHHL